MGEEDEGRRAFGEARVARMDPWLVAGYAGAVLLPVVGLVIALVLLLRGDRSSAGGVAVVSLLSAVLWVLLISG